MHDASRGVGDLFEFVVPISPSFVTARSHPYKLHVRDCAMALDSERRVTRAVLHILLLCEWSIP